VTAGMTMEQCICGHAKGEHIRAGGCRVPGCPCDRFQPIPEIDRLRLAAMAETETVGAT